MTLNLRALAWVVAVDETLKKPSEIAYALGALYVYRRELDLSQDIPRPRYWRATHRDVLANECNWGDLDPGTWIACDETGKPQEGD